MFYALRNLFALVGLLAVIAAIYAAVTISPMMQAFDEFDEKAIDVYSEMVSKLLETGNAAEATIWKVQAEEGLSAEDIDLSIKNVANELNIKNVGELPLPREHVEATFDEHHIKVVVTLLRRFVAPVDHRLHALASQRDAGPLRDQGLDSRAAPDREGVDPDARNLRIRRPR